MTIKVTDTPKQVIVFLSERINSLWYPVIELHDNCQGGTDHRKCTVLERSVVSDGFDTKAKADAAVQKWLTDNQELLK